MTDNGTSRREFLGTLARGGAGLAVAGGLLPELLAGTAAAEEPEITVLTGVTVIDGTGAAARPGCAVVLVGDRIVAVGRLPRQALPAAARVVRLDGKYVIPGLWDMHVHTVPLDRVYPPLYVVNGVTGIREMYGYFHPSLPDLRDRIERGDVLGPRMVIASNIIDGPHSVHAPTGALSVATEAEARAAVRTVADQGADFVKVYSFLHPHTFAAVAAEARRLDLPIAGHIPDRIPAGQASAAGLRSAEHLFGMFLATSAREDELRAAIAGKPVDPADPFAWYAHARAMERRAADSPDPGKAAALFARLRRHGTWQSPTLTVLTALATPADGFDPGDPRLRYLPDSITGYWWEHVRTRAPRTPEEIAEHRRFLAAELRMVGALDRAGTGILAGTDANNPFCFPGFGLHDELALLVEAGLPPMRALQAATLHAARFLGLERTAGTVAPGKVADLVVLDGDPLADIRNTSRIHAVLSRGRYLGPERRRQVLADIERAAREPLPPAPGGRAMAVRACAC